jgi:hypothetical protein
MTLTRKGLRRRFQSHSTGHSKWKWWPRFRRLKSNQSLLLTLVPLNLTHVQANTHAWPYGAKSKQGDQPRVLHLTPIKEKQ